MAATDLACEVKPNQMKALVACAQHKSLRAAADQLALSHSALTKSIRELEDEFGVPLVVRSPRGIRLTAYGQIAYERAFRILGDIRRTHEEIVQLRGGSLGRVVLATSVTMAFCVLPAAFLSFRALMPDIEVEVRELERARIGDQLERGEVDFVVTHQNLTHLPADCEFTSLCQGTLAVIVRREHPARRCRRLTSLLDFEWLYPGQLVTRQEFENLFVHAGVAVPRRVTASHSSAFTTQLVGSSDAVALLPRPFIGRPPHDRHFCALRLMDALPPIAPGTVVFKGTHLPPAASLLREKVHEAILAIDWR